MKFIILALAISTILFGCSSFQHDGKQRTTITQIECNILAREKSLFDAIHSGDKQTYIEHLADKQYENKQDDQHLDQAIENLHQKTNSINANPFDPHRSEVKQYLGTITLNRDKTLAYANHGFGIARCLGCRAIQLGDITTMKSVWQLENDGRWRRRSNRLGPRISVYKFKYYETQCPGLANTD
jgi:hypothetical protein